MPKRRFALAAAALLLVAGCGAEERSEPPAQQGAPAPPGDLSDVVLRPLEGPERTIADYGGKILIVNFIATWNNDSKALVPVMNEIQKNFVKNVTVIGIAIDEGGPGSLRNFARENDVRFELFTGGSAIAGRFGAAGRVPRTYVLTREARIFGRFTGLKEYRHYHEFLIDMYRRRM